MSALLSTLAPLLGCLLLFVIPMLSACGGGGAPGGALLPIGPTPRPEPRPLIFAHYGDSLTSGGTVPRVQAHMPGTTHIDRSYGGSHARFVLEGLQPWAAEPFASAVERDGADWLVLRFGAAEVHAGIEPAKAIADLGEIVDAARAAGKRVVLIGAYDVPVSGDVSPEMKAAYLDADQRMRALAAERGLVFIDVLGVPVAPAEMHDEIHPGPVVQERIARHIAAGLGRQEGR